MWTKRGTGECWQKQEMFEQEKSRKKTTNNTQNRKFFRSNSCGFIVDEVDEFGI